MPIIQEAYSPIQGNDKRYRLLKDYESPCKFMHIGVILTEKEWIAHFVVLREGDCDNKTDWFEEVTDCINLEFSVDDLAEGYDGLSLSEKREFMCKIIKILIK